MEKINAVVKLWTDGSYIKQFGVYGGGVYIECMDLDGRPLRSPKTGEYMLGRVTDCVGGLDNFGSWNVTGEVMAVLHGIQLLQELEKIINIVKLEVLFDYKGIEFWITGKWSRKKPISDTYYRGAAPYFKSHNTIFTHVKGHTSVEGNEIADSLAYEGANNAIITLKLCDRSRVAIDTQASNRDFNQEARNTLSYALAGGSR